MLERMICCIMCCILLTEVHASKKDVPDSADKTTKRPNIIYLLADDLGYNDIGYNNREVLTPTLDKLATSGRIFTQSYFQSTCTPSRAALLSGIYPFKIGIKFPYAPAEPRCVPINLKLLPQVLRENGYKTHFLGKWHLGYCKVECTPTYRGFDTFYGGYLGGVDHFNHTDIDGYGFYDWRDGLKVDRSAMGHYSTELLTERAIKIIQSHNAADGPLFAMVSFAAPHLPNQVPDKYLRFYPDIEDKLLKTYYAMITALDVGIRKLYDNLLHLNMMDDTLIIFSSDNGGDAVAVTSDNTPLRGSKGTLWEGGNRVVTFIHGPMLSNHGQVHDGLIHAVDWYPTLAMIAGADVGGLYLDGVDQSEMVLHGRPSKRSQMVYNINLEPALGQCAIRIRDYKLIWGYAGWIDGWGREDMYIISSTNQTCFHRLVNSTVASTKPYEHVLAPNAFACLFNSSKFGRMDPTNLQSGNSYLFNIKDDPEERNNLAGLIKYEEMMLDMKKHIVEMTASLPKSHRVTRRHKQAVDKDGNWSPGWCDDLEFNVHLTSNFYNSQDRITLLMSFILTASFIAHLAI